MDQETKKIIDEIEQLRSQYIHEIGEGGRKPWPRSIKDRVVGLCEKGIPVGKVSRLTGIPYHSMLPWRKQAGMVRAKAPYSKSKQNFHALTVTDQVQKRTVTEPIQSSTVTVQVTGVGDVHLPDVQTAAEFVIKIKTSIGGQR